MDFSMFRALYFNSFDDFASWIFCEGSWWTLFIFILNVIFSIIYDFVGRVRR